MKPTRLICASLVAAMLSANPIARADVLDFKTIAPNVAELLEKAHYSRRKIDDSVSKELLKNYLDTLDYNHLFFTQKDVDNFTAKYGATLDNSLLQGDVTPVVTIFNLFKKRVEERVAKNKKLLEGEFKFDSDRFVEFNRQNAPWAKDEKESDQLWQDRVEGEMLDRVLMDDKADPPVKVLTRRYNQLLRNVQEQDDSDVVSNFLSVLAQTYDPHSEFMSPAQLATFKINMQLSLVGIGAVLTSEEGYAKIRELMPGGPAAEDGRLKVGDRISAVAQGDGEFVETIDMKLDKVVEMIRGKKDTVVRLQCLPVGATDPSTRKVVEIVRREVKLKDQEAKAQLVERKGPNGKVQRLGLISLPSFYADMDHSGMKGAKSTTKDVLTLLNRLKQENIEGLILDLRRDGGGSLDEAVNLTGLFIKNGPVVVARDSNGRSTVLKDRDKNVAYDGPMLVLCNRLSASASEIFAAALQDYNRALVVGDTSTFGKGTVQTMVDIGRILPVGLGGDNQAGALKLTIQKFYRIAGGSTQLKGVSSDIRIPSIYNQSEIGESALKGPMPYDTIEPVAFTKLDQPLYRDLIARRSRDRVEQNPEFRWILEDLERAEKRIAENKISLNETVRRSEIAENKARREEREKARENLTRIEELTYQITLDNAANPALELAEEAEKKEETISAGPGENKDPSAKQNEPAAGSENAPAQEPNTANAEPKKDESEEEGEDSSTKSPRLDVVRGEALNILADLIEYTRNPPAVGNPSQPNTAAVK